MTYVRREYPEWSWSFSRYNTFTSCRRKYYYQYYASHNGWEQNSSELATIAYRLKKIINLYTTLGDAVHKGAEELIHTVRRGKELPAASEVEESIRTKLRFAWRSSTTNRQQFMVRPNRVPMLHEFYYGDGPSKELVDTINERAVRCADSLIASKSLAELGETGTRFLASEQFDTFVLHGTKVFAVPDLMYITPTGTLMVVDWKTGRQEEQNNEQVALYALYAAAKYNVEPTKIVGRLEYLNNGTCHEETFTEENINKVNLLAEQSMQEMQALLLDPDQNIAKPKAAFPLTTERYQCRNCNFLELCAPELRLSENREQDSTP